ncbi:BQ2448_8067 [Microbotryum intermedium]|uniref:BQ2448_8067 protein n=1 Tax=Microbotryum intermedium TaxID=269621 RepID=A0A238FT67_9BASI|nr:BQ2448_8067 [Microbotryum intermedium]
MRDEITKLPGIVFQKERATVEISRHTVTGASGNIWATRTGVAISKFGKCAATQYGQDEIGKRDQVVVPYVCQLDEPKQHTAAKVACGHSPAALSLAEKLNPKVEPNKKIKFHSAHPRGNRRCKRHCRRRRRLAKRNIGHVGTSYLTFSPQGGSPAKTRQSLAKVLPARGSSAKKPHAKHPARPTNTQPATHHARRPTNTPPAASPATPHLSEAEISDQLTESLMRGQMDTGCIIGVDHLSDMQTGGWTAYSKLGYLDTKGIRYDPFEVKNPNFWLTITKVTT